MSLNSELVNKLRQRTKEKTYVTERVKEIREHDNDHAEQDGIYDMTLSEFLEWFDRHATQLYTSVGYSRIKNRHDFSFSDYAKTKRKIAKIARTEKSTVKLVRCNSKLRMSFNIVSGPLRMFGSTMLFDGAVTIQKLPNTVESDLKHCIQFNSKFKKLVNEFAFDIQAEAVYRKLNDVRSTAIYRRESNEIITY